MEGEACEQQSHVIRVAGAQVVLPIVGYLALLISIYLKWCSEDICPPVVQEPAERRVRVRVKLDLRSTQSTSVSVIIIIINMNLYLASGLRLPLSKDYDSTHNKL